MKKTAYIFACLLVAGLVSCNKALDQAPDGKISLEEVFADNDKTMYYLNSCYSSMPGKALEYFFWARGPVNWCDDAWDGDDLDVISQGSDSAQFSFRTSLPLLLTMRLTVRAGLQRLIFSELTTTLNSSYGLVQVFRLSTPLTVLTLTSLP